MATFGISETNGRSQTCLFFFFQAEDGIRDLVRSRGLGDVYKRQAPRIGHRINGFYGLDFPITLDHRRDRRDRRDRQLSLIHI